MTASSPFSYKELGSSAQKGEPGRGMRQDHEPDSRADRQSRHFMTLPPFAPTVEQDTPSLDLCTPEDLARAVEEARRATAQEVEAETRATMAREIEQRRCDLLLQIKEQLGRHEAAFEEELTRLAVVSEKLALALAKAVIPRAIELHPLADITDILKAVLSRLVTEPSIELRLSPDLIEAGRNLLDDLAAQAGFRGDVSTVADPAFGPGDAELRWKGGAVDRRLDRLQAEILDLVDRWLDEPPDTLTDDYVASTPTQRTESTMAAAGATDLIGPTTRHPQTNEACHER